MNETTKLTYTYVFVEPDFLDEPPELPDGASEWERQEARILWSSALSCYRDAVGRIVNDYKRLIDEPASSSNSRSAANDAQSLAKASSYRAAYLAHVHGIEHRLALASRGVSR